MYNCSFANNATLIAACCADKAVIGSNTTLATCEVANASTLSFCLAQLGSLVDCIDIDPRMIPTSGALLLQLPLLGIALVAASVFLVNS